MLSLAGIERIGKNNGDGDGDGDWGLGMEMGMEMGKKMLRYLKERYFKVSVSAFGEYGRELCTSKSEMKLIASSPS